MNAVKLPWEHVRPSAEKKPTCPLAWRGQREREVDGCFIITQSKAWLHVLWRIWVPKM